MTVRECIALLKFHKVPLSPGLTASELRDIERSYGFEFGTDHRRLLEVAQPTGEGWLDWRRDSPESIRSRLAWPVDGVVFDVENAAFWPSTWPQKPDSMEERRLIATERVATWPTLIPLYSHRYLPAASDVGAPVFSVYQTDVIFYGVDILDYLQHEFGPPGSRPRYQPARAVSPQTCPPWSLLAFDEDVVD
ncbi:hypothetical protein RN51_00979 [Microbacterium oxydans]|uniref:Knr4/Smi1-like domain-containing protein n=1 Tax=Microbacterium oxydans TaxID=82380 RepID=A0A0F0KWJ3_9MICO|nr:hypothetical protein [Microbacterium oxydans]KJL24829.1 hypothetical protein RN51_00979 [Microbacterium oxydans]